MEFEHGTLVRVHNAAFSGEEHVVEEHGNLWLCMYQLKELGYSPDLHSFKSVATGYEHAWYRDEFEVPDDGD